MNHLSFSLDALRRSLWVPFVLVLAMMSAGCSEALLSPDTTVSRLDLVPTDTLITEGEGPTLEILAYDDDGRRIDDKPGWTVTSLTYTSDDPDVLAIQDGKPVGVGGGETTLRAALGDLTGSTLLRVNPSDLTVTMNAQLVQSETPYEESGKLEPYTAATLFLTVQADEPNFYDTSVDLLIYNDGTLQETLRSDFSPILIESEALREENQWKIDLPPEYVREGLELAVRIDPENRVPTTDSSVLTFPEDGTPLPVDVRELSFVEVEDVQITQSTQRADGSIPLVAGRDGLLRVFLRGDPMATNEGFQPTARAFFYENGSVIETIDIPAPGPLPAEVDPSAFDQSWNAVVPGSLLRPGVSLRVVAVPDQPTAAGDPRQFPRNGTPLALNVTDVPPFKITLLPVEHRPTGSRGDVSTANAERYLRDLRHMFPVSDVDWEVRSALVTDTRPVDIDDWSEILRDVRSLQVAEASDRYYYGVLPSNITENFGGLGYRPGRASIGYDRMPFGIGVLAHELGHNFGRRHTPCGNPGGVDTSYPYDDANIGVTGYNVQTGEIFSPFTQDFMSYCNPVWISDYSYEAIFDYRQRVDADKSFADARKTSVLLVRGGISPTDIDLDPAFSLTTTPVRPDGNGPYVLEGRDAQGGTLFRMRFSGDAIAHLPDGHESFVFALPANEISLSRLASLHVRGNGVSAALRASGAAKSGGLPQAEMTRSSGGARLSWNADRYPGVLVRDAGTGEIVTFGRGGTASLPGAGAVDVTFSDGIATTTRRLQP